MRFNRIFLDLLYEKKHAIETEADRLELIDTFDGEHSSEMHRAELGYVNEMKKNMNWLITEYLETHNP